MKRTLLHTVFGVGAVSGVFFFVMAILVVATFVQVKRTDPLNTPELVRLRERFATDAGNDELKNEIRALDLLARKAFFTSKSQVRTGNYLLLGSLIVFVTSMLIAAALTKKLPDPAPTTGDDTAWAGKAGGRTVIVVGGVLLGVVVVAIGLMPRVRLAVPETPEETEEHPVAIDPAPPSLEDVAKNWPCFRGVYGNATVTDRNPPTGWNGETGENIIWKVPIRQHGYSSPVVWGSRIFFTGGDESLREVYCYDAETGELLWSAEEKDIPDAPPRLPEVNDNTGWTAPTPVTDGNRVFFMFATGNVLAFDMDGKGLWARHIAVPNNVYAHASSLIMRENLLFVQLDDSSVPQLLALNPSSGETVWKAERTDISWASPICLDIAGRPQIVLNDCRFVTSYDPLTGDELWRHDCLGGEVGPSPAYADGMVFVCNAGVPASGISVRQSEDGSIVSKIEWQWQEVMPDTASPLATEKYVYLATSGGLLFCLDAKTGTLFYEQEFDDGFYSSPVLVNDLVYMIDLEGVTHVFRPADAYEAVGTFPLGEPCSTVPAFVGDKIYIRGDDNLFCIGENE